MSHTFDELVQSRYSCRSFDASREVTKETLKAILENANLAPSACNAQPYAFHVATGEAAAKVAEARDMGMNKFIENCPAFIAISEESYNLTAKVGSLMQKQDYRSIDIGIACSHIAYAAEERGLQSCILGMFDEKKLKKLFKTRQRIRLVIAIGYSDKERQTLPKKRKDFDAIVHWHS